MTWRGEFVLKNLKEIHEKMINLPKGTMITINWDTEHPEITVERKTLVVERRGYALKPFQWSFYVNCEIDVFENLVKDVMKMRLIVEFITERIANGDEWAIDAMANGINMNRQEFTTVYANDTADAVLHAFDWIETKQGYDHWNGIFKSLV